MLSEATLKDLFAQEDTAALKRFLLTALNNSFDVFFPTWHPLGFVHCKLGEDGCGQTYRLHLWLSSRQALLPQEHKIHDHLFDVKSIVLTGAVESKEYDLVSTSATTQPTHRVLRVDYAADGPRLYEDGTTGKLLEKDKQVVSAGASYEIQREALHESSNHNSTTSITLVRTSNPKKTYNPRIVVPTDAVLPPVRQLVHFSEKDWRCLLQANLE